MANKSNSDSTFDFERCLKEKMPEGGADADNPEAYCGKMKYYVDNNLGWPGWARSEDMLSEDEKQTLLKALD